MSHTTTVLTGKSRAPFGPMRTRRAEALGAWTLLVPYTLLFLVGAAIPIGYAFVTALQKAPTPVDPTGGFGGLQSFVTVFTDHRFWNTFQNIFVVMIIWLPIMVLGIVGLALLLHASPSRFGGAMRFIYYIPGALGGIANFVLWVYLIDPQRSPIAFLWQGMGANSFKEVITAGNMPGILTAMLFFQGVGTWIIVVNGGLNGISEEVLEAARLDGANAWQLAWNVKLPIIRAHERRVRFPAVPRAVPSAADLVRRRLPGVGADAARIRVRVHQPRLPRCRCDVDRAARDHPRHRMGHRAQERHVR